MRAEKLLVLLICAQCVLARSASADTPWEGYAGDAQHTAVSSVASQPLQSIHWQTSVDLNPQLIDNDILIHYGSPMITSTNTVIVPQKTGADGGFRLNAFSGATGAPVWSLPTDYALPPHFWIPSYSPTLTPDNHVYYPGAGGTVYSIANANASTPGAVTQTAFFGNASYAASKSAYDSSVFVSTPLTSDSAGNVYFGYHVTGLNPLGLQSGIARVAPGRRLSSARRKVEGADGQAGDGRPRRRRSRERPHHLPPGLWRNAGGLRRSRHA